MDRRTLALALPLLAACGGNSADQDSATSEGSTAGAADEQRAQLVDWLGFEPPQTAKLDVLYTLWEDQRTPRSPADGAGSARFVGPAPEAEVGRPARFELDYTAGPLGVAEGGAIYLQAPPFWGWSTPQAAEPAAPGYTTFECDAQDLRFEARAIDTQLLVAVVRGRDLAPGEVVHIVYGAGPAGVRVDRYGERDTRLWLAVDGDGDGVRALVDDAELAFDVAPGPASRLLLHLPATAHPGETITATLAVVDGTGSDRVEFEGAIEVEGLPGDEAPRRFEFGASDSASRRIEVVLPEAISTLRLVARVLDEAGEVLTETESNPCRVSPAKRVLFCDLQGHSGLSDGTGTPDDYYTYARYVGGLDAVALTDHDRWGLEPLETTPELWDTILAASQAHDEPGRFLALTGFEWTSWLFGHRHVVHLGAARPLLSAFDRDYDTPPELWAALDGTDSLSIPHTLAGGPVAVDWSAKPPLEIEPVVELVSVHGSSDTPADPRRIYSPVDGHWFEDVLGRGYRYGIIGSGDGHDGHPGMAHLSAPCGGLAGILSEDLTRAGLLEALRARRCYGTSGARIVLRTSLASQPMGAQMSAADVGPEPQLLIEVFGTAPLERIEIVDETGIVVAVDGAKELELRALVPIPPPAAGGLLRVRVLQTDRHMAWSSPYYFD
ncbi:DUF3604 domain-containing protein [Engelhardtia mirabilis]|uniref:DUF3604 domain-containing protein n=1 Tax=Engelhardtia mirabilis TaxID=2528011 RepID=A0A518BRK1_9BACT|nr:hypothetical protein Pla133_47000 [Planctomycetes bacterium Pla133]QDV03906.1 hypothetical protein Pla86_46980 [Planctomycetes bacterium Pla86]